MSQEASIHIAGKKKDEAASGRRSTMAGGASRWLRQGACERVKAGVGWILVNQDSFSILALTLYSVCLFWPSTVCFLPSAELSVQAWGIMRIRSQAVRCDKNAFALD